MFALPDGNLDDAHLRTATQLRLMLAMMTLRRRVTAAQDDQVKRLG